MSENINNLNKQIASFMLVSLALSVPISAQAFSADNILLADASINMQNGMISVQGPMLRYAAPQIPYTPEPIMQPVPAPPAISMYAAPQMPIVEPIKPIIEHPIISMYAAPEHPIIRHPHPHFHIIEPLVEPDLQLPENKPILNESSVNLNNLNQINQQPNIQSGLPKTSSMNINAGNTINAVNMNVKTDGFVPSQFGNIRIIEPYAHFVFK